MSRITLLIWTGATVAVLVLAGIAYAEEARPAPLWSIDQRSAQTPSGVVVFDTNGNPVPVPGAGGNPQQAPGVG